MSTLLAIRVDCSAQSSADMPTRIAGRNVSWTGSARRINDRNWISTGHDILKKVHFVGVGIECSERVGARGEALSIAGSSVGTVVSISIGYPRTTGHWRIATLSGRTLRCRP